MHKLEERTGMQILEEWKNRYAHFGGSDELVYTMLMHTTVVKRVFMSICSVPEFNFI